MNYSTLKKTVALSVVALMAVGIANAQTTTTTTTDSTKTTSTDVSTAKVFGGAKQYRTFSIGVNGGITGDALLTGGRNNGFDRAQISYGYGLYLKQQWAQSWSTQLDLTGGQVKGDEANGAVGNYKTNFYQETLNGSYNFASIDMDYLHRERTVNFYLKGGAGLIQYRPTGVLPNGAAIDFDNADGSKHYISNLVLDAGAGVKFRLNNVVALDLGYTENFVGANNFDGTNSGYPQKDHYAYGYAGLEFTLGAKSKPALAWANPVAQMYDELYDAALRQEVEALKGRVTNVETAVADLKKDSDGDGVSDQFDKCPNTPAGSVVDGSGCVIVFPKDTVKAADSVKASPYSNIQFEFDSSVLRTSSYPALDASSADLRASGKTITLAGYASSEGTAAHNLRLSKDRATSVKTYLVNSGVDAKHLKVKGFGETHPIADNSTEEGRVANRRVEFHQ
jgi:OmpA-OmpF porin, OOP family